MSLEKNGEKIEDPVPTEKVRELFQHWVSERYEVFLRKKNGAAKPWSTDPIFRSTYFCNVHRENDRVSQWIRAFYNPHVADRHFVYNIVFSRFINWPETLGKIGYLPQHDPDKLEAALKNLAQGGKKIWGNAYIITTHGMPMSKVRYLTHYVLSDLEPLLDGLRQHTRCAGMATALQAIDGIGSFLSAQIIADLKNTPGYPLFEAQDKRTFVTHGPGSLRGASWLYYGRPDKVTERAFYGYFSLLRDRVERGEWPVSVPEADNQDLQNCLCEFDKYMRIYTATGRSKRSYPG